MNGASPFSHYAESGGEFRLYNHTLSNAAYASVTKNRSGGANSFQTFCVELDENVYSGQSINLWVSTSAVDESNGTPGPDGSGSHAWSGGDHTNNGDNLDARTAYLYTQFAKGLLSGYDYDNTAGGRNVSARELQEAIWALEGENVTADGQAATWMADAQAAIDNNNWSGLGNVRILQSSWNGNWRQDMLYLAVPVPGAALLGLFSLGLVGWMKRRLV